MKETRDGEFFLNVATSLNYVEDVGKIKLHKLNTFFKFRSACLQFFPHFVLSESSN